MFDPPYLVDVDGFPRLVVDDVPVAAGVDRALVERHDVLRQGTRLITAITKILIR